MEDEIDGALLMAWGKYFAIEPLFLNVNNQLAGILSVLTGNPFDKCGGVKEQRVMSEREADRVTKILNNYGKNTKNQS